MIVRAGPIREELVEVKLNFKNEIEPLKASLAGTCLQVNGHAITLAAKKIVAKGGHLSWKVTWWLDGRRVGFNALIGTLEREEGMR